ncbi:hypothetical protein [Mycolicibacterium septicum]|uniref:hypothetical protein n=1 Tax=Mycolicibacterium septicum TaxID=98668 RepID=UPI002360A31B|nr:hypothetical protein [Mycolicibacterium septicum]
MTAKMSRRATPTPDRLFTTAAEWLGFQLAVHPRIRRLIVFWLTTHALAIWTLAIAPHATASTMAAALNWTGITDSHGVPVGAYFLSTVDTMEAIADAGPDVSLVNPGSWVRWGAHAVTTGITHDTIASWIQAQASIYIFMLTAVLWLLRFAMSSTWLYWLATWFRPVLETLRRLLTDLHVFPICLALGLGVGGFHMFWHGRRGHGATIMLTTFIIGMIGLWLTRDPLTDLYSDNGLLNQGRNLAFGVAQAATNNGPISAGGTTGQLSHLTGLLADALIRAPLQIWNFGTTVDSIGTCGHAWSQAILSGVRDAPAHAMQNCGAPKALVYARGIDGTIFALGTGFGLLGLIFTIFVTYVTYSYIMVAGAAFMNAIMALFAVGPAMIHGRPRRRARRRLEQFFRHAFLVFVYVLYISCTAIIILKTVTPGGYASQVGMTNPVAMLVLVAVLSAAATGLFWWLKRELLHDTTTDDLKHTFQQAVLHTRSGYSRGEDKLRRGFDSVGRTGSRNTNSTNDSDKPGNHRADTPITNEPVPGRQPGGKPPGSRVAARHGRREAALRAQAQGGAMAGGSRAAAIGSTEGAAVGAVEAGAALLAPEVVIPAAIAATAAHRRSHGRRTAGDSQPPSSRTGTTFPQTWSPPAVGNVDSGRSSRSDRNPAQVPQSVPQQPRQVPRRPHSPQPEPPGQSSPPESGRSPH